MISKHTRLVSNPFIASLSLLSLMVVSSATQAQETASGSMPAPAYEAQPSKSLIDDKAIFNLNFENDIFGRTDQNYTNGVRVAWMSSEANRAKWLNWLADNMIPWTASGKKRVSIAAGQNMYTPQDLSRTDAINGDRPYAGWLYGSVGVVSDKGDQLDSVMLSAGVVGPYSQAEKTQKLVHKLIDAEDPKGWDNQLKNEPGILLTVERKWRGLYEFSPFGAGIDVTPHVAFNAGNINTDASAGFTVRIGFDLPSDYGPPRIRPSLPGSDFFVPTRSLGGYLFAGADGRAVARNIFLDGNSFRDGPHVDKEILVGTIQAGMAITYQDIRLSYTHVYMTREYKRQSKPQQFGSLTLAFRY